MAVVVLKWRNIETLLCTECYAKVLRDLQGGILAQLPHIYSPKEGVRLHR